MNELLARWKDVASLLRQGHPLADVDAWVSNNTEGRFASVEELRAALAAERDAANARERQPDSRGARALRAAGGATNTFAQGVTAGLFDEIMGAAHAAIPGGKGYREGRDQYRQVADEFRAEHPVAATASQVGGGLATGLLTAGLLSPATTAGYLPGVIRAAGVGAGYGAVAGAGEAPELADVPRDALRGAAFGGVTGGALGAAIPPVLAAGRFGKDWLGMMAGRAPTLRQMADLQVGGAVGGTAASPAAAVAPLDRAAALGLPRPVPADVGGEAQRLARQAINRAPGLTDVADDLVAHRTANRAAALARGLEQDVGMTQAHAAAAVDAAPAVRQAAARQLYGALDNTVIPAESDVNVLLAMLGRNSPAVQQEIERVLVRRPGDPLLFQHVQAVVERLRGAATSAFATKGQRDLGVVFRDAARQVDDALMQAVPDYQAAAPGYRIAKAIETAYQRGAKAPFARNPNREVAYIRGLRAEGGDEAVDAYRAGFLEAHANRLRSAQTNRSGQAVGNLAGMSDDTKAVFRVLFPDDAAMARFQERVALTRRQAGAEARLTGNSTTAQQTADLGTGTATHVAKAGASGAQSARAGMIREFIDQLKYPQDQRVAEMVGRDLLAPYTPATRDNLLRQMQLAEALRGRRGLLSARLVTGLLGGREAAAP